MQRAPRSCSCAQEHGGGNPGMRHMRQAGFHRRVFQTTLDRGRHAFSVRKRTFRREPCRKPGQWPHAGTSEKCWRHAALTQSEPAPHPLHPTQAAGSGPCGTVTLRKTGCKSFASTSSVETNHAYFLKTVPLGTARYQRNRICDRVPMSSGRMAQSSGRGLRNRSQACSGSSSPSAVRRSGPAPRTGSVSPPVVPDPAPPG